MATYVGIGTTDPGDDMIFGDNNVGIGTTVPTSLAGGMTGMLGVNLQVRNTDTDQFEGYARVIISSPEAGCGPELILETSNDDTTEGKRLFYVNYGANMAKFQFLDEDDTSMGQANVLVLKNDGSVGVGTSSPSCTLDVVGLVKASTAVKTPAIRPVTDGTTALQIQKTDGTPVMNVDTTNSRVGIGSTSPSCALDAVGTVQASIAVKTPAIRPVSDGTTALQVQKTDGTPVLNVDTTNGRVGIGTTSSPSERLEVYGKIKVTDGENSLILEGNDIKFNRDYLSYIRNDVGEDSQIAFIVNSQDVCRITPTKVWIIKELDVDSTITGSSLCIGNAEINGDLNHDGGYAGFYGTTPVAKQTGVAVTAAAIHQALVNLGLIS